MTRITLTLDTALAASLREEALRDDRPMSSIARRAFNLYFAAKKSSAPVAAGKKEGAKV